MKKERNGNSLGIYTSSKIHSWHYSKIAHVTMPNQALCCKTKAKCIIILIKSFKESAY